MIHSFQNDLKDPKKFVITLELVPKRVPHGRSVDTILAIAQDAKADGRISAVTITDNPGGNPSISPDVLGHEIYKTGMDVIVHLTCRDMNRIGIESRALQLSRLGMNNILALTGDYPGNAFGGQGAPVYDLDSVSLLCLLRMLNMRNGEERSEEGYFAGCSVSPFKATKAESFAQYAKLCRKINAGASFVITQLGYDTHSYGQLLNVIDKMNVQIPVLGSVYLLSPNSARVMNNGQVPGAVVSDKLYHQVVEEWKDARHGLACAVDRTARLGLTLKKQGYAGIHLGGIHRSYEVVKRILDRMEEIESSPEEKGDSIRDRKEKIYAGVSFPQAAQPELPMTEYLKFHFLKMIHTLLFNKDSWTAPYCEKFAQWLDERHNLSNWLKKLIEDPVKSMLLSCRKCGDCAIHYLAFQCPESGCPKHTRNGACGGSRDGRCEVFPDKWCVWVSAFRRLDSVSQIDKITGTCIPPRMWELNNTSAWLNYYLHRDHQSSSTDLISSCSLTTCRFSSALINDFQSQSDPNSK